MSLLIVNYEYPPIGGGAASASYFLAKALAKLGEEVVVMTSGFQENQGYCRENGIHVHRLRTLRRHPDRSNPMEMGSFLWAGLLHARKIARMHRVDKVIVFFTVPCGPIGYWLKLRLRLPYVVSLRGGDVPGFEPRMCIFHRLLSVCRQAVLRRALALVANSPGLAELSRKTDPYPVRVIPNGVDVDFFQPPDEPPGSCVKPFAFLFAGRFHVQKNLFFLMDRLKELKNVSRHPFVLHLVGDGPQKGDLQRYATRLGLEGRLIWYGWLDKLHLSAVYRSTDCFINPSLYEGLPNTVLEAMASGLPVVASRIPGHLGLVKPGETGYLASLNHPVEFTLALKAILEHSEEAAAMGKVGRKLMIRDFSWDQVAQKYSHIFLKPWNSLDIGDFF